MRPLLLAVLALLILPLTASAEMTNDDQWSRYRLSMSCADPAGCAVPLTISYQFVGGYPDFKPTGPRTVADTKTVAVPAGTHDVVLETDKVIEAIASKGGPFYVFIEGGETSERGFGNYSKVGECGGDRSMLMRYGGKGKLHFLAEKDDAWNRVSGPVTRNTFMTMQSEYRVSGAPITFSYRGVSYTVAKGSRFAMSCTGVSGVKSAVLSPRLISGKVSVKASKRKMRQPAAWVMTNEGNLGTRAKETTSFTVTRSPRLQVSKLSMKKGKLGTITPWNSATRSPCRAGETLKVNRRGVIS